MSADLKNKSCLALLAGHVTDLKDVSVTCIALGKAHAVALTNKGQIFTFGINNKGQCGRDFTHAGNRESEYYLDMDILLLTNKYLNQIDFLRIFTS